MHSTASFVGAGRRGLVEQALHQAFEPIGIAVPDLRSDLAVLVDHKQGGKTDDAVALAGDASAFTIAIGRFVGIGKADRLREALVLGSRLDIASLQHHRGGI